MIRIYLDWNVFSRLGSKDETHKRLTEILSDETKFLIPYSEAHLIDIYRSYKKVGNDGISGHLDKLQQYSKSLFITDTIKHQLEFQNLATREAMQQYIEAYNDHQDFNFDLAELIKPFESLLEPLLNFQIPNPLLSFQESEDNKTCNNKLRTTKDAQKLLGDEETTSFGQIMENLLKMSSTILQDNSYSEMRDNFQKDLKVNTGRLNNKRFDPMETLDENAQKLKKENFMELHQSLLIGNDDKSLFNRIIALCRHLDFNGFFADNITPEHHLDNVETDYKHIGYASTCDIFIISDKKTKEKAIMAFDMLNIKVEVLSPQEFVAFSDNNFVKIENKKQLIDYLFWVTTNKPILIKNGLQFHYVFSYVLDYFNIITTPIENPKQLVLRKFSTSNNIGVLIREITEIRNKLLNLLGNPIIEYGNIGDEFYAISWMTEDLVLFDFKYIEASLILDVQQCRKMKRLERILKTTKEMACLVTRKFKEKYSKRRTI
ncbi:hypothetical protein GGR22_000703 [Flavobacterium gossypii]|uniref:DUF4935 domain-containing protein n=1 Tax=Flavobacterium gossypii TaxID=1646119 RepID=A0ABR6DLL5_9FLAO|nr:hypothetical protein [Flavobacterium gossypii]MBA9072577.1 hypothetical protein [Flavobacterium gossypii]